MPFEFAGSRQSREAPSIGCRSRTLASDGDSTCGWIAGESGHQSAAKRDLFSRRVYGLDLCPDLRRLPLSGCETRGQLVALLPQDDFIELRNERKRCRRPVAFDSLCRKHVGPLVPLAVDAIQGGQAPGGLCRVPCRQELLNFYQDRSSWRWSAATASTTPERHPDSRSRCPGGTLQPAPPGLRWS